MELGEILAAKDEYDDLQYKVEKQDREIHRIEEQIWDLETEIEGLRGDVQPLKRRLNDLAWELGIKVSKDQLPLFDLEQVKSKKPWVNPSLGFDFAEKKK